MLVHELYDFADVVVVHDSNLAELMIFCADARVGAKAYRLAAWNGKRQAQMVASLTVVQPVITHLLIVNQSLFCQ